MCTKRMVLGLMNNKTGHRLHQDPAGAGCQVREVGRGQRVAPHHSQCWQGMLCWDLIRLHNSSLNTGLVQALKEGAAGRLHHVLALHGGAKAREGEVLRFAGLSVEEWMRAVPGMIVWRAHRFNKQNTHETQIAGCHDACGDCIHALLRQLHHEHAD
jgi:hypothetical protein